MTSSMLAGDRRWAPARRGSMVTLGKVPKVVVPKPINLPSQRLENHGLDPNVEIVPKGSHSWGNRPSSSTSNPWGSSVLSPNADGTTVSPSHASGCPSSGGSGTRPSTSSSDRIQDPIPSAWGPNSRPSSASGALTSNQTSSMPLRAHSAEARPGSSQLSRFAEPSPDNPAAWGPTGPVDKMVSSTKKDGFSLSSGDFPTLGAEKENSGKITESQDSGSHGRHDLSSARSAPLNDTKDGTTNAWRRDGTHNIEDGVHPSLEKWPGGYPQPYLNPNVPPHCYDAWNGPPINAHAGVWYGGPSGGPPYGPPIGPGRFPVEPFPYYRPQMPPRALGNSHTVAGPRGHHPKNGDVYRPQIPDAYMHPGMPVRPGFYPHLVAYDNYYGPPMGYCNPNERDVPFRGMASGPPVFNQYPSQNTLEPGTGHARDGGRNSNVAALVSEQMETAQADNSRGPYKVISKPPNEWDAQEEEGRWEHTAPRNVTVLEKVDKPRKALHKNECGADNGRDKEAHFRKTSIADSFYSKNIGNHDDPLYSPSVKSPELSDEVKTLGDNWRTKSGTTPPSYFLEQPHVLPAAPKDSILLRKIDGLNARARASDGRQDNIRPQYDIAQIKNSMDTVGSAAVYSERTNTSSSFVEIGVSTEGLAIHQPNVETSISRRTHHGVDDLVDHGGKGRLNNPDADGWRTKPLVAESFNAIPAETIGSTSTIQNWDHHTSVEASGKFEHDFPVTDESDPLASVFDSNDSQAQRSKMKELARQRAMQLQKEEEERIKEQKSKALAKLEELNRRTQAVDGSTQKMEKSPPSGAIVVEQLKSQDVTEPVMVATRIEGPSSVLVSGPIVVAQAQTSASISGIGEPIFPSKNLQVEASNSSEKETAPQSLPSKLNVSNAGADVNTGSQVSDSSVSKNKSSYKQKQIFQGDSHFPENFISFGTIGVANITGNVEIKDISSAEAVQTEVISGNSNIMLETPSLQKKKFTRNGKNKNKLDDPLHALPNASSLYNQEKSFKEGGKAKASWSELDAGSAQSVMTEGVQLSELQCSARAGKSIVKMNNQRKSQSSRKIIRNGQSNKGTDKSHGNDAAIWAPVRTQHKTDATVEDSARIVLDTATVTGQNEMLGQKSLKSKRAEMERYVPKPVAKEFSLQGSTHKAVSSSFVQNTSDETAARADSRFQRTEGSQSAQSVVEKTRQMVDSNASWDNNNNNKHITQEKAPGTWQQWDSTDLSPEQNPSRNAHHEPLNTDKDQVVADTILSDGWGDGWNMLEEPNTAVNVTFGMKDQGGPKGKGKRHPYKSHKSMGNKHDLDLKNINSGGIDKKHSQASAIEPDQEDPSVNTREYCGIGERVSSHWQPKSQGYSGNTQFGGRSSGKQHVPVEAVHGIKRESPLMTGDLPSMQDTEVISKQCSDQSVSKSPSTGEATVSRHQEGRRERKIAPSKERSQQDLAVASLGSDVPCSAGQDNKHPTGRENRERRLRNPHYEYQPVGPYNNKKSNYIEGPTDGSRYLGSSFRGRGHGHSKRGGGNFYVRQIDAVKVDARYD